jgi:HEPN domain-containing protein
MREDARRLLVQAEHDLDNAGKNLGIGAFEVVAFLCQQAVEKALKAAWMVLLGRSAPFTHNLLELARGIGEIPAGLGPRLFHLGLDYTVARYPDAANGIPHEQYDKTIASERIATAKEAMEWIRDAMGKTPTSAG